jgi:hypothetical protein
MKKHLSLLVVLNFLLLNYCFSQKSYYQISGTILNTADLPKTGLVGAKIQLLLSDSLLYEAICDSNGYYILDSLNLEPAKTYYLECPYHLIKKFTIKDFDSSGNLIADYETYISDWGGWGPIRLSEYLPDNMFPKSSKSPTKNLKSGLKSVAHSLDENPTITILISGHSDYDETISGDTLLAYNRAKVIKKVLVDYGVDEKRITIKSLGMTKPFVVTEDTLELKKGMILNETPIKSLKSKESIDVAHQFNRRISIEILRTDFIPE